MMQFLQMLLAQKRRRVYLDHAAATPLLPAVARAMHAVEAVHFANPSAIHAEGVAARKVVDGARAKLARLLAVREPGIVFTGSGTESNNLAIIGTVQARHQAGVAYTDMEVVTTAIEHPSVTRAMEYLETLGVKVLRVPVSELGHITYEKFVAALTPKTVLVSFAYVNSEVGVVQRVSKLARAAAEAAKRWSTSIVVHVDAAQAPLWLPCQLDRLHVDLMSLDAGKCGGPKGVGVVAMRHGVTIAPVLFGGPQEGGLRPATENVVGIVGGVEALVLAQADWEGRSAHVSVLRDQFITELLKIDGLVINGDSEERVANNVNISIPGIDSEFAVICLDEAGIAASTKSACSGAGGGGSAVVMAMTSNARHEFPGGQAARAQSTIRFTLGPQTKWLELEKTVSALKAHVTKVLTFQSEVIR